MIDLVKVNGSYVINYHGPTGEITLIEFCMSFPFSLIIVIKEQLEKDIHLIKQHHDKVPIRAKHSTKHLLTGITLFNDKVL